MEISKYVKIYDDVLNLNALSSLIRYINTVDFEQAKLVGDNINFNIRRTYNYELSNMSNSFTSVHWYCLLHGLIFNKLKQYGLDIKSQDFFFKHISNITILKYENTGFYTWHTDHCADIPRTLSCIFLLNNDYEGGNLCFRNPDGSGEWEVEVKPNRMILWPSNFLYPHTVKPVTKGRRYSIVAWAL